ncbi:MAG: hypothetical protein V4727_08370 [Verrucomicrobiota bacterium]
MSQKLSRVGGKADTKCGEPERGLIRSVAHTLGTIAAANAYGEEK